MQEIPVRYLGLEYSLEKEMVTHSSILAWRILWTEELGCLQLMGSQGVEHDRARSPVYELCGIKDNCSSYYSGYCGTAHVHPLQD